MTFCRKKASYDCKLCNKKYVRSCDLVRHINMRHNDLTHEEYYATHILDEDEGSCVICGKQTRFLSFCSGFKFTCDMSQCENTYKYERTIEALNQKYGVSNPSQLADHVEKMRATKKKRYDDEMYVNSDKAKMTNLHRYGAISCTGTASYNEKYHKTVMEKYGVEHHTQLESVKQKARKTSLKRYGVEHPSKNSDIQNRTSATFNERYGGRLFGSQLLGNKAKKTMLQKYGTEIPLQNSEIRARAKATCIERYGVEHPLQNPKILHRSLSAHARAFRMKKAIINNHSVHYQSKAELRFIEQSVPAGFDVHDGPSLTYEINGKLRIYHVDFVVTKNSKSRLIEVKQKHIWYLREKESGVMREKARAAQDYSGYMCYLPYKVVFM